MGGGAGFPAAVRYSRRSWRRRQLNVTVFQLRCDHGGLGAWRLRAERCAEGPVLPAPRSSGLPPPADATPGSARGHSAEPGEELPAQPSPGPSLRSLAPPISSGLWLSGPVPSLSPAPLAEALPTFPSPLRCCGSFRCLRSQTPAPPSAPGAFLGSSPVPPSCERVPSVLRRLSGPFQFLTSPRLSH